MGFPTVYSMSWLLMDERRYSSHKRSSKTKNWPKLFILLPMPVSPWIFNRFPSNWSQSKAHFMGFPTVYSMSWLHMDERRYESYKRLIEFFTQELTKTIHPPSGACISMNIQPFSFKLVSFESSLQGLSNRVSYVLIRDWQVAVRIIQVTDWIFLV